MHSFSIKSLIFASALLGAPATIFAKAAMPWPIQVQQKDGSELTIQKFGDERASYTLSEDGYPLLTGASGLYEYAVAAADGKLQASGVQASEISQRTMQEKALLQSIDRESLVQTAKTVTGTLQREIMASEYSQQISSRTIPDNMLISTFPNKGKQKSIVVLVEFKDLKMTTKEPFTYFNNMLNQKGFSDNESTGSVHDYFLEVSDGQFDPEFDVYGPITLDNDMAYYGHNSADRKDVNAYQMAIEVCEKLDSKVDFSQYDRDGDGLIDNVFIFYAGQGESGYGGEDTVWPHAFKIYRDGKGEKHEFDGVILNNYGCGNEWERYNSDRAGTFIHEFSHILGLPDLYNTADQNATPTPRTWSAMDQGNYNNGGATPPLYSVFERVSLGWIKPLRIKEGTSATLYPISNNLAFYIQCQNQDEFFLFENRQQTSWDKYLMHHGMLVWHVDYDPSIWFKNTVNNTPDHLRAYLMRASGDNYNGSWGYSDSKNDPFPGRHNVTELTSETTPGLVDYLGKKIDLPITNIAEDKDGIITFDVKGGGTDMEAPKNFKATNIEGSMITLNWDAVKGADSYILRVKEMTSSFPTLNNVVIDNVTSYKVTGLKPNSTYYCKVMAANGASTSAYSEQIKVSTGNPTLADLKIDATNATDIKETSFVAHWVLEPKASNYLLNLSKIIPSTIYSENCNFNNKKLPIGWTTNVNGFYESDKYFGEAAPAMLFSKSGDYVQSPKHPEGINKVSFTLYGVDNMAVFNPVNVYYLEGDQWIKATSIYPQNVKYDVTYNFEKLVPAVKLEYSRKKSANLVIDDIVISGGRAAYESKIEDRQDVKTGNKNSFLVDGLQPGTEYRYTIRGTDGTRFSSPSKAITVWTKGESGIESISNSRLHVVSSHGTLQVQGVEGNFTIYDLQGREVYTGHESTVFLPSGIYIVKAKEGVAKAIVR